MRHLNRAVTINMKYFLPACLALIFAFFNANAQRNFKSGYIVSLAGDTTRGAIDYKDWNRNPGEILFKNGEQTVVHNVTTITDFAVDGFEHYKRYIGKISMGSIELSDLSVGIDSSYVTDTVFLKTIKSGNKIKLYQYVDNKKERLFISDAGALPVELERYVFIDVNRTQQEVQLNRYRQQLYALSNKYQPTNVKLFDRIQRLDYNASEVGKLVAQIDPSSTKEALRRENNNIKPVRFFAGVAMNVTSLTFETGEPKPYGGDEISIYQTNKAYYSSMPMLQGGVDVFFNKNVQKFILRTELSLSYNKHNAVLRQTTKPGLIPVPREDIYSFNQFLVSLNPQLLYNFFNAERIKIYLAGGLQMNYAKYSNDLYTKNWYYNDTYDGNVIGTTKTALITNSLLMNATAKAGVTVANKLDIFVGYASSVNIANDTKFSTHLTFYRLGVSYLLGKK